MEKQQFREIVARLERSATANPSAYRTRVVLFGALGYAYVAAVLLVLLVAFGALVLAVRHGNVLIIKLGIALVALMSVVARALWIRLPPPEGRELSRPEAPQLFALIDDVVKRTGAPPLATVFLTADLNASIVQVPKFGVFGGYRSYLSLGLPVLQALTPEEFSAVLAHECGHLSEAHGKSAAWIYRIRAGWEQMVVALEESEHWGRALFLPFFRWYAPRFAAYSFVAARQQEIDADRVSAAATSPQTSARALLRVSLADSWLRKKYWPSVFEGTTTEAVPQSRPMRSLGQGFAVGYRAPERDEWLADALQVDTDCDDTHPCLRDRLAALGVPNPSMPELERTAAQALLGPQEQALADEIDEHWLQSVTPWWQNRHEQARHARDRRAELETAAASRALSIEEDYELGCLKMDAGLDQDAEAHFGRVADARPDHADAHARLGFLLARRRADGAVEHLRSAIRLDPDWTPAAGQALATRLRESGDVAGADAAIEQVASWHRRAASVERESMVVRKNDRYEAVRSELVNTAQRAEIADAASRLPDIARLWLVAKVIDDNAQRVPVVIVQLRSTWWKWESGGRDAQRQQELAGRLPLPTDGMLIVIDGNSKWLKRVARRNGEEIYRRR